MAPRAPGDGTAERGQGPLAPSAQVTGLDRQALAEDPAIAPLLRRCTFPAPGALVVCALSGGPDSSALLVLAVAAGCSATAVHVDHGLRAGSAAEADVAAALARRLGAGFRAVRAVVPPGPNLEARARRTRHRALPPGACFGHTADDQVETMLLNLMRGAALDGLAGIRPGHRHPLLALRRAETRALCLHLRIDTVTDPSNEDPRYLRNRVRHELVPLLAELSRRDVVPLLARQAGHLRAAADQLEAEASELDPTDAQALSTAAPVLAAMAVRRWLRDPDDGHPPDTAAVSRVLAVARGEATATPVSAGRRVARRHGRLRLEPATEH